MDQIFVEIFKESFFASFLISFSGELYTKTIISFPENYNMTKIFVIYYIGGVLALLLNYGIGLTVAKLLITGKYLSEELKHDYGNIEFIYNRYVIWTGLFAGISIIGGAITTFGGLLRARSNIFVPMILLSKAIMVYVTLFM